MRDILLDGVIGRVRGTDSRVEFKLHGNLVEVNHKHLGMLTIADKTGWEPKHYYDFEEEILINLEDV